MSILPKLGQPRFLTADAVLYLHSASLLDYGGLSGVRDPGSLESALAQPRATFAGGFVHDFPFGMAAAYAFHIARNHPFLDGNKRTAFATAATFLSMQGWRLTTGEDAAAEIMESVASGSFSKESLQDWLAANTHPRPSLELRDFFAIVSLATLAEVVEASVASDRAEEADASLSEAAMVMRLVADLGEAGQQARSDGDNELADRCDVDAAMFAALFRIAEDMGYEW